jgi:2-methylisocitrate lyase-like PEP mutase family enzyme
MDQVEKASRLRALHQPGNPLVLVNAWDAASARVVVAAGAQAVATSSAAAAYALGYPDGERISRDEMLGYVATVVRAVDVPVTADMEAGYGPAAEDAAATARGIVEIGAVGFNLEDASGPGALLSIAAFAAKIGAVRQVATDTGVPLVLNARVDVFIESIGEPETRLEHAVERGRAYRESGADCVFVPVVSDAETIEALVQGIGGRVSVLATPGSLPVAELARLGVARVSTGSGPYRLALSSTQRMAREAYGQGTFTSLADSDITHADAQRLLA